MSYIVTARKWRPQIFDEVIGQEHISKTLKNAIVNNRLAHAYIFTGPRGVGKTTTARILAKSLNCLDPKEGEPCNTCEMCTAFQNTQTFDVIEIDGASNRRIDEIRTLRESVKYAPTKGKYKIYIIDEVHMLTPESFNALLKTLEEPPEKTVFVFATTDVHKVPLTIMSRCQRFDFRRIDLKNIISLLKKIAQAEKIKIDDKSLMIIAKKADGALRDAQSLFDQIVSFCGEDIDSKTVAQMLNLIDEEIFFAISDAILTKEFSAAFEISQKIYNNGWNFIDFLNGLVEHFRNIMTITIRKNNDLIETAEFFKEKYLKYIEKFSEGDLIRILNFLNKVQNEIKYTQNQKLKVEISLCHLIGLEKSSTLSEVLKTIDSSEAKELNSTSESKIRRSTTLDQNKPRIINKSFDNPKASLGSVDKKTTPEIKSFVPPSPLTEPNLDSIVKKWENFVDQVHHEKFTFGSILANVKIVDYDGQNLNIELEHDEDKNIIDNNKKYINQKTKEIFGKKIELNYSTNDKKNKSKGEKTKTAKNESLQIATTKDSSSKENLLIKSIINELGGREI